MGQMHLRVGELIKARELRDGRRLDIAAVARDAGITPDTLASMIDHSANLVSLDDLAKLCDYFHCTAGELLHYDADPNMVAEDEIESRDIVARWERTFGADERLP